MNEVVFSQRKLNALSRKWDIPAGRLTVDARQLVAILRVQENMENELNQLVAQYGEEGLEAIIKCAKTLKTEE